MSCPNATAPIDINRGAVVGKCDLKCEFSFHYNDSSCIATNRGDYISLSYESSSSPPVTYNSSAYNVKEVRIYSPSLHSFNGTKSDGEMIIVHNSSSGAVPLLVCIPIKSSNSATTGSKNLTTIINTVATNAPADTEQTTINISRFNLNAFVPRKPFFSYSATEPYQPCSSNKNEYIVFSSDSAIGVADKVLVSLQNVITENAYDIKTGPALFFNEKGPSTTGGSDQIYIDCQPVGESEEEEIIITDSGSASEYTMTASELMENKYFQMFLGSVVFIALMYIFSFFVNMYVPKSGGSVAAATSSVTVGGKKLFFMK